MVLLPLLSRCVGIPPPPSPPPAAAEGEREAAGVAQPLPPSLERAAAPPPPHGASPGRVGTTRDGEGTAPGRERARSRAGRRRTGARIPLPPGRRSRSGSGRSAAPPLGEGGRDASRVLLSPAPRAMWALPAGLLRSGTLHAVKRKGGGGGEAAAIPVAKPPQRLAPGQAGQKPPRWPLFSSPRSPRRLVRPAARHAGIAWACSAALAPARRGEGAGSESRPAAGGPPAPRVPGSCRGWAGSAELPLGTPRCLGSFGSGSCCGASPQPELGSGKGPKEEKSSFCLGTNRTVLL